MKVFIRDTVTGLYFRRYGEWTQQDTEAHDFITSCAAHQALPSCGRDRVEVVLRVPDAVGEEIVIQSHTRNHNDISIPSKRLGQQWKFVVFVAGVGPETEILIKNLQKLLQEHAGTRCELDIVDVEAAPSMAEEFHIFAVPTIVRMQPTPIRKLVGDFSEEKAFLQALGLQK
ncbi:MAG: circadian clock KaiB family protein [Limisphaerales bacterium]